MFLLIPHVFKNTVCKVLFSLIICLLTSGFIPCSYPTSISHPVFLKTYHYLQAAPNDDYLQFWVFFLVRYSFLCLSSDWEIHQCTAGQFGDQSKHNAWICAQANLRKRVGVLPYPHIHSPSATQLISKSWLLISKPCLAFCHYDIYWCSYSFCYYSVIIWVSIKVFIIGFS